MRRVFDYPIGLLTGLACGLGALTACSGDGSATMDMMPTTTPCKISGAGGGAAGIKLTQVLSGAHISRPVQLLSAGDGTKRTFIVGQTGHIYVTSGLPDASGGASEWLNIESKIESTGAQSGLLGLAFDPGFSQNGRFYISSTRRQGGTLQLVVSRLTVSSPPMGMADPTSEMPVLSVNLLADTHVSGHIAFGSDGFLYIGTSDGGLDGDPQDNAKNTGTLLGKLLRIGVSQSTGAYDIPPSNPLVGMSGAREEIYAYGLRNPWRFSIDPLSGIGWIADQGQSATEELETLYPGANYGWNSLEGITCYKPMKNCTLGGYPPTYKYPRTDGGEVIGGLVYRGQKIPSMYGAYVFGDQVSGALWMLPAKDDQRADFTRTTLGINDGKVISFGADADGELYVLDSADGAICRMDPPDGAQPAPSWPLLLSQTGYYSNLTTRKFGQNVIGYDVNVPLWSDGAAKERGLFLPPGATIAYTDQVPAAAWTLPQGAVAIKTFLLAGKPVETRLLRNQSDGWHGATYRWNPSATEASLMTTEAVVPLAGQPWPYPSRADCIRCHTKAAAQVLGWSTAQMNRSYDMLGTGTAAPQISTLKQLNALSNPPAQDPSMLLQFPNIKDNTASLTTRARAYLHANCAHCHQPGGLADATFDIRFSTPFNQTGLCGVAPQKGDAGVPGSNLIEPGVPNRSVLYLRMSSLDPGLRMPSLGSKLLDPDGTFVVYNWIQSLTNCN